MCWLPCITSAGDIKYDTAIGPTDRSWCHYDVYLHAFVYLSSCNDGEDWKP